MLKAFLKKKPFLRQLLRIRIEWTGCGRVTGRSCDQCFSITYDDAQGGSDIMCMRRGNGQCIFTGNLISDNSFVAVTAESGQCRPFSSDPLEVSTYVRRLSTLFYEMCTYVHTTLKFLKAWGGFQHTFAVNEFDEKCLLPNPSALKSGCWIFFPSEKFLPNWHVFLTESVSPELIRPCSLRKLICICKLWHSLFLLKRQWPCCVKSRVVKMFHFRNEKLSNPRFIMQ